MAKYINAHTGAAVFLNGHLLTPHKGKMTKKDHNEPPQYILVRDNGMCEETQEYVAFSYTNRYVLRFGDDGRPKGISFTQPVDPDDTLSLLDTGAWGLSITHYRVGASDDPREISFDE